MDLKTIFKKIHSLSKKEKTPVYVVGGFVRDLLLKNEIKKDVDFVVVGDGLAFAKSFDVLLKETGSLVEFPDFGTARYILKPGEKDELILEFASARTEKYDLNSRKPKVELTSLEEDLSRRDFTVNAMALSVECFSGLRVPSTSKIKKEVVDPFNGQKDLETQTLRTPLDPD